MLKKIAEEKTFRRPTLLIFMPPSRQNIYLPTTLSKQGSDKSGKTWKLGINLKMSGKIFVNILFWIIIKKSIDLKYAFCQRFVCLFVCEI